MCDQEIISRDIAASLGLKRYFTNLPCKHGHRAPRLVSTLACTECSVEASRRRYEADPDHRQRSASRGAKWRAANREDNLANLRKWHEANRARQNEKRRVWRLDNLPRVHEYLRRKYATDPAYRANLLAGRSARKKSNRLLGRIYSHNRRARKHAVGGTYSASDVQLLLELHGHRCANHMCGADLTVGYHIDHIVPIARGGGNDLSNLQPMCPPCNLRKGTLPMEEFLIRYFDREILGSF